jgi:hypothetical protein
MFRALRDLADAADRNEADPKFQRRAEYERAQAEIHRQHRLRGMRDFLLNTKDPELYTLKALVEGTMVEHGRVRDDVPSLEHMLREVLQQKLRGHWVPLLPGCETTRILGVEIYPRDWRTPKPDRTYIDRSQPPGDYRFDNERHP